MNKYFLIISLFSIFLWITYFFRPLTGADPYFYLHGICNGQIDSVNVLFNFVLGFIPCDVFFIQVLLLVVWLCLLYVVFCIGYLLDSKNGWWLGFVVFFFTFFVFDFWKFENDVFGFLFSFVGWFFVFKFFLFKGWFDFNLKRDWFKVLVVLFWFGVAGLFWKGVVYWLVVLPFFSLVFVPLLLVVFVPNFFGWFFGAFSTSNVIYEHSIGLSVVYLFITMFFLIGFIKTPKKIVLAFVVLFIMSFLVLKLYVLSILFTSIISFYFLKMLNNKFKNININQTLIIWGFFMTIFFVINLTTQFPTQSDINLIENTIQTNPTIENEFGTGHLIKYLGGNPNKTTSYSTPTELKGTVIDIKHLNYFDKCILLEESKHLRAWNCD